MIESLKFKVQSAKLQSLGRRFLWLIFWLVPSKVLAYANTGGGTTAPSGNFLPIGGGKIKIPDLFGGEGGPAAATTFGDLVIMILNIVLLVVGGIAVISLIWGGFRYLTAYGNEEQAEAAKRIIKHSILGLIIVILSFAIVMIITNVLITGTP